MTFNCSQAARGQLVADVRTVLRLFMSLITAISTCYFVFWVGGDLLFGDELPYATAWLVSLTIACLLGLLVWTQTAKPNPGLGRAIFIGAAVTAGFGFFAGFFGPILITPRANQGPMLGIFITGPLGFVLGAVGGFVYAIIQSRRNAKIANDRAAPKES